MCQYIFSDMPNGVANTLRRCEGAGICKRCTRQVGREGKKLKSPEQRKIMEKELSESGEALTVWRSKLDDQCELPQNGKVKGCHGEEEHRCNPPHVKRKREDVENEGLEDRIHAKRARFLRFTKVIGTFWPSWKLQLDFKGKPKEEKPKLLRKMVVGGESGYMIGLEWGCPEGICTKVKEHYDDGVEFKEHIAKSELLLDPSER